VNDRGADPAGRLGFLAPMPSELKPLRKALSLQADRKGIDAVHTGTHGTRRVVAMLTGVGMPRAARRTEDLLATGDIDHVVVIGVAGALGEGVRVGQVVVPEVVIDLHSGRELRPSRLGDEVARGRLLTSNDFLTDPVTLTRLREAGATAIDMETAAVAAVCEDHGCPWSVFRGISDDAFDPLVDEAILALTRPDGSPDLGAVARFVAGDPRRTRLLARLGRDLTAATSGAADAALRASSSS
jgi:adenosylhomocysteine nucleosidase